MKLFLMTKSATSPVVPIGLAAPRAGNTLLPGDLLDEVPPGLDDACTLLTSEQSAAARQALEQPHLARTAAAIAALQTIVDPPVSDRAPILLDEETSDAKAPRKGKKS